MEDSDADSEETRGESFFFDIPVQYPNICGPVTKIHLSLRVFLYHLHIFDSGRFNDKNCV